MQSYHMRQIPAVFLALSCAFAASSHAGGYTWTQTSQADFETGTLTDVSATQSPGDVVLEQAYAFSEDIVGNTSSRWAGTHRGRPNWYRCTEDSILLKIETRLLLSDPTEMTFVVYESAAYEGPYSLVHSNMIASVGPGSGFFSSGPISVPLRKNTHYLIGGVWQGTASFYSGPGNQVAFGQHLGYTASVYTYPPPATISVEPTVDSEAHFSRLTTMGTYAPTGMLVTTAIEAPALKRWGPLTFSGTAPTNTTLAIDVLDSAGGVLLNGAASGTDLGATGITNASIKLRARFATADSTRSPILRDWSVRYEGGIAAVQIPWVRVIDGFVGGRYVPGAYSGGINSGEIALTDIDGNGTIDLFVCRRTTNPTRTHLDLYANRGTPSAAVWSSPVLSLDLGGSRYGHPVFCDIDGDDDNDLFVAKEDEVRFYENIGDAGAPVWASPVDRFEGLAFDVSYPLYSPGNSLAFADIDGDDDLDAFMADTWTENSDDVGTIAFFRNTGSVERASFELVTTNYAGIAYNNYGSYGVELTFCDIDADSDQDLFLMSLYSDDMLLFENTGSVSSAAWAPAETNLNGQAIQGMHVPCFADIDDDGDLDLFALDHYTDGVTFIENRGDAFRAMWAEPVMNYLAIDGGIYSTATFGDLDNDRDFDLIMGRRTGGDVWLAFYENVGSPAAPFWAEPDVTYLPVDYTARPALVDINGDAVLDLIVGNYGTWSRYGPLLLFENTGTVNQAAWAPHIDDYAGINYITNPAPAFADIDHDGDMDMFVGEEGGRVIFFENEGSAANPVWGPPDMDYNGIHVGAGEAWEGYSAPAFGDIDHDGDLDMFVGRGPGSLEFYENIGTAENPIWDSVTEPYGGIQVGSASTPALCDIDDDGDLDLFVGEYEGGLNFWRNQTLVLNVNPSVQSVGAGSTIQFSAPGYTDSVTWSFRQNGSGGTIDQVTGVYTAGMATAVIDIIEGRSTSLQIGRAHVNVISAEDITAAGKAIIIAGGKSLTDPVWRATDYLANKAYNTLRLRGFVSDNIRYHSFDPTQEDVYTNTALDVVEESFTSWADGAESLFVYMVDHGSRDRETGEGFFRLNPGEAQYLASTNLAHWLDVLQTNNPTMDVTVVMDFCYAGSFLDALAYVGPPQRTLISATADDELTYFIAGGLVSFSEVFFTGLAVGMSMQESFELGRGALSYYQDAQLDDDGDGKFDPDEDGAASTGVLGPNYIVGRDIPQIGTVMPNLSITNGTAAALWAEEVSSPAGPIVRAWCTIVPPNQMPDPDTGVPVTDVPEVELLPVAGQNRYQATFSGFAAPGPYAVIFHAEDIWGGVSLPKIGFVTQAGFDERAIVVGGYLPSPAAPASVDLWINEFHYDNSGADAGEFVEVVVGPGVTNPLDEITVTLYNGSGGGAYDEHGLHTFTQGATEGGYTFYSKWIPGIQNGAPDALALAVNGTLVSGQFLSYEGTVIAQGGVADQLQSVDIGVAESGSTPLESSLGLTGEGLAYDDFTWAVLDRPDEGVGATPGLLNSGQQTGGRTPVERVSDIAYLTLRARRLAPEDIYLMHPARARDIDGDRTNDVDALPTTGNLANAITNWGVGADALTVHLVGGADGEAFRINSTQTVSAAALDAWLDAGQSTGTITTVVLDFPGAGGFIQPLTQPTQQMQRIVMAGTRAGRDSLMAEGGTLSFSQFFMGQIAVGQTIGTAFAKAGRAIRRVSRDVRQYPQLDDSGNGVPNEKHVDGTLAYTLHMGTAFVTGDDAPLIGRVMDPVLTTQSEGVPIWVADVTDVDTVTVWCVVSPPGYQSGAELEHVDLSFNDDNMRYEVTYSNLHNPGTYGLTFYAMDSHGTLSEAVHSEIVRSDIYETDDSYEQASLYTGRPQFHALHSSNDVDWVRFYAVSNFVYEIETFHMNDGLDTVLDVYRELPDGTLTNIIPNVDDPFSEDGELTGLDFPASGWYYVRVSQDVSAGWYPGSYDLGIYIPVGAASALTVLAIDLLNPSSPPPNAQLDVTGPETFSEPFGGQVVLSYSNITDGSYAIAVPPVPGYVADANPTNEWGVKDPQDLLFGNPRSTDMLPGEWGFALFAFVPVVRAEGVVRDGVTGAWLAGATLRFTARDGEVAGQVFDRYPSAATYSVPWVTRADGSFPTNVVLPCVGLNMDVQFTNYVDGNLSPAIVGPVAGAVSNVGMFALMPVDANSNNIADWWESQYFPGGVSSGDSDGDGMGDGAEYRAGTDPTNATSVLATGGGRSSGDGFVVTWPTAPGRAYKVSTAANLTGGMWSAAYGPVTAKVEQSEMSWTNSPVPGPRTFYRIDLVPPR